VLAFDHRVQFVDMAAPHGAGHDRIVACKKLIAEGARQGAEGLSGAGVILDDRFGEEIFPGVTGCGRWVARPVELPGSRPLKFEAGNALGMHLRTWPGEHVAKCLVYMHPDDPPDLRRQQLDRLRELQAACIATFREFLIEVIPPADMPSDATTVARALEQIYAADVVPDWWKLPPSTNVACWDAITQVIRRNDPIAAACFCSDWKRAKRTCSADSAWRRALRWSRDLPWAARFSPTWPPRGLPETRGTPK
jgi:5-dehydro-2-deoxygluconokinase